RDQANREPGDVKGRITTIPDRDPCAAKLVSVDPELARAENRGLVTAPGKRPGQIGDDARQPAGSEPGQDQGDARLPVGAPREHGSHPRSIAQPLRAWDSSSPFASWELRTQAKPFIDAPMVTVSPSGQRTVRSFEFP